jgi:hypothetical protein
MSRSTYILETKTLNGVRGERVHKVVSYSITEAIQMFAQIKQLRPDQIVELFSVYEQPPNGK